MQQGGTWDYEKAKDMGGIPNVMDTGSGKRTTSQPVNYSWGKDKQKDVTFFKYVGDSNSTQNDAPQVNNMNSGSPQPVQENQYQWSKGKSTPSPIKITPVNPSRYSVNTAW